MSTLDHSDRAPSPSKLPAPRFSLGLGGSQAFSAALPEAPIAAQPGALSTALPEAPIAAQPEALSTTPEAPISAQPEAASTALPEAPISAQPEAPSTDQAQEDIDQSLSPLPPLWKLEKTHNKILSKLLNERGHRSSGRKEFLIDRLMALCYPKAQVERFKDKVARKKEVCKRHAEKFQGENKAWKVPRVSAPVDAAQADEVPAPRSPLGPIMDPRHMSSEDVALATQRGDVVGFTGSLPIWMMGKKMTDVEDYASQIFDMEAGDLDMEASGADVAPAVAPAVAANQPGGAAPAVAANQPGGAAPAVAANQPGGAAPASPTARQLADLDDGQEDDQWVESPCFCSNCFKGLPHDSQQ